MVKVVKKGDCYLIVDGKDVLARSLKEHTAIKLAKDIKQKQKRASSSLTEMKADQFCFFTK